MDAITNPRPAAADLVPLPRVLDALGVSRATLRRAVERQEIEPPLKIGRRLLWPREALERFVAARPRADW